MKLVRFFWRQEIHWGVLEDNQIYAISGSVYGEYQKEDALCRLGDVKLLAPAEPSIMVCIGVNYRKATDASGDTVREERAVPRCFFKPVSTLMNPFDGVRYPAASDDPHAEVELCVVIKRRAKNVPKEKASEYILGYTCGNELGALDFIRQDKNVTRGRGFDTSGPLGPHLITDLDTANLKLTGRINGEEKQVGSTAGMIFSVAELIEHITSFMTLQPGDVVWSGTPPSRTPVKVGDIIEAEIEGIGILRNEVLASR
ncbi:MAG: fumarylacetoacetate hydrolase family protein [Candidatus Binatia bacterium]|jgi:2-keto-4-pentenoate hydratase/2-oxohepta-3-ene-1,7-dioic acid hydratase in catechol pathway|nr:fumarylacetoacetate hydrolase family protein [Candidatus Binatia bacterium]